MSFKVKNLLILDDDSVIVRVFEKLAKGKGWTFEVAKNAEEALEFLGTGLYEVALVDVMLPGFSGMQFLEHAKINNLHTEIIIMTGLGSVELAVNAMRMGAYDYLAKPFDDMDRVAGVIEKAMERYRLLQKIGMLERKALGDTFYEEMIGRSMKMQEVFNVIESIAPTTSTVLIYGESGTGKELVAKAIHSRSKRKDKPFVVINCSAIPTGLLESEIFGHIKGAFTGAIADKKGLFEEGNGGTVFLDEISEVPPAVQVKLLRVLQDREIRPVGATDSISIDVRLVVATNVDLAMAVHEGRFREDLYYRINVIGITLPPLRERREDIPLLVYHFLKKFSEKAARSVEKISIDALQVLQNYSWAGNVRELENIIERAVVLASSDTITAQDLPPRILGETFYLAREISGNDLLKLNYKEAKNQAMESFNRSYITGLLQDCGGNVSFAAERAVMDRSNFKKLIIKYGISVEEFKKK